jgi:hypothetical protein
MLNTLLLKVAVVASAVMMTHRVMTTAAVIKIPAVMKTAVIDTPKSLFF